jgi:hypothetical protein
MIMSPPVGWRTPARFAAFSSYQQHPWILKLATKLMQGDPGAYGLLAKGEFSHARPPKAIRAAHYTYKYSARGTDFLALIINIGTVLYTFPVGQNVLGTLSSQCLPADDRSSMSFSTGGTGSRLLRWLLSSLVPSGSKEAKAGQWFIRRRQKEDYFPPVTLNHPVIVRNFLSDGPLNGADEHRQNWWPRDSSNRRLQNEFRCLVEHLNLVKLLITAFIMLPSQFSLLL